MKVYIVVEKGYEYGENLGVFSKYSEAYNYLKECQKEVDREESGSEVDIEEWTVE